MKTDMYNLEGKIVVLTGGAGFLGKEFSEALAEHGANLAILDLDEKKCRGRADQLAKKHEIKAIGIGADITKPSGVKNAVAKVVKSFGKIDVLINGAAVKTTNFYEKFESYPLEDWEKVMAVNLTGAFLCTQEVLKEMRKQGSGSIINISSIYGVMAPDQRIYKGTDFNTPAVYSASKAGLIGLTKYLASYLAGQGIRVNCISPGGVFNEQDPKFVEQYSARVPLGRMAKKNELNGAVLFLASDASSYVTGQNLIVDGGLSCW